MIRIKISKIIQETNVTQSFSIMSKQSVQTDLWHSTSIVIDTKTVTLNVRSKEIKPDNEFIRPQSKGPVLELPNIQCKIIERVSSKHRWYQ